MTHGLYEKLLLLLLWRSFSPRSALAAALPWCGGNTSFLNPIPVVVVLLPLEGLEGRGLLVIRRGLEPCSGPGWPYPAVLSTWERPCKKPALGRCPKRPGCRSLPKSFRNSKSAAPPMEP